MIRSTKVSLKFSNRQKREHLHSFIEEGKRVVGLFVDMLWNLDDVPRRIPKSLTSQVDTWLSARAVQAMASQASGIVRGTRKKQEKRLWMVHKLEKEGKSKRARKLYSIYRKQASSKPVVDHTEIWLDSRFVKIALDNPTSFDGWVTLSSLGNKLKLRIPFKKHRHFNKLISQGKIVSGVRLGKKTLSFVFDIESPPKQEGGVLGIDIGMKNVVTASSGFSSQDFHGHNLSTITQRLSRKRKGSKGFEKVCSHRTNYINWAINQMKLSNVSQINVERIRGLRKGKRTTRFLSHWVYRDIFGKLERYCEEQGVLVRSVSPTYTSQRCSHCGWTRRGNRKGKQFRCDKCGNTLDADLNASRNIALKLPPIRKEQRLRQISREGFYWFAEGQEPIVPVVRETC